MKTLNQVALLVAIAMGSISMMSCGGGGSRGGGGTANAFLAVQNFSESQDFDSVLWGIPDAASGLELISDVGVRGFDKIRGVEFVGSTLYGVDARSDYLCTIDTATGRATPVGPTGHDDIESLAYDAGSGTLYAANLAAAVLRIDTETGLATEIVASDGSFLDVRAVAFHPGTGRLYGYDNKSSVLFYIDPSNGMHAIVGTDAPLSSGVQSLTFGVDEQTLYASVRNTGTGSNLVMVDRTTGSATLVGSIMDGAFDLQIAGMDFHPSTGVLYGVNDDYDFELIFPSGPEANALVTIDAATGVANTIGACGMTRPEGLAFDRNAGILYVIDSYTDILSRVDVLSGRATAIGRTGLPRVDGLAFDPNTNTLYGSSTLLGSKEPFAHLITIDTTTGAGTDVGAITGRSLVRGLAFDAATDRLFGCGTGEVFEIDETTGVPGLPRSIGGADFAGLEWDPVTQRLFGSAPSSGELVAIEPFPSSGPVTVIGTTDGRGMAGLAHDPATDTFYGVSVAGVARLDRVTARASFIGCTGLTHIASSAFDPMSNRLYVVDIGSKGILPQFASIDAVTGEGTIIAVGTDFGSVDSLAFDRNTQTLYGVGYVAVIPGLMSDGVSYPQLFRLDLTNGDRFNVGSLVTEELGEFDGLAFDATNNRLYGHDNYCGDLYVIDTATAQITLVGHTGQFALGCLTYDHVAGRLYGVQTGTYALIEIDPANTEVSMLGTLIGGMEALESSR